MARELFKLNEYLSENLRAPECRWHWHVPAMHLWKFWYSAEILVYATPTSPPICVWSGDSLRQLQVFLIVSMESKLDCCYDIHYLAERGVDCVLLGCSLVCFGNRVRVKPIQIRIQPSPWIMDSAESQWELNLGLFQDGIVSLHIGQTVRHCATFLSFGLNKTIMNECNWC